MALKTSDILEARKVVRLSVVFQGFARLETGDDTGVHSIFALKDESAVTVNTNWHEQLNAMREFIEFTDSNLVEG